MIDKLQALRGGIDKVDEGILLLLKDRVNLMEKVGKIKKINKLPIRDDKRERDKIESIEKKAKELGLPIRLVSQFWNLLFLESEKIEG